MKHKPSITLPAAFLAIASETVLLDPAARKAIATDGEAIAIQPLPGGFTDARTISKTWPGAIEAGDGAPAESVYDLDALRTTPAYRIALNPAKLAALAAALGAGDLVILSLPASPAEGPIHVCPAALDNEALGYLMPQPMPEGLIEGLLLNPQSKIPNPQSEIKPKADLPPPVVTASEERHTLEIAFGGKPADEIREALKDPALGFRYSGRGTKRGVPPAMWYGPDNPFTREKITELLKVSIAA